MPALSFPLALACQAQTPTAPNFTIEQIKSECIAVQTYPVPVAPDECTVVDSGQLVIVDGKAFYFARYQITTEVPFWPDLRDIPPSSNALIIFVGEEGSGNARMYRDYSEDLAEFQRLSFPEPQVLDTSRGKILNIRRRDSGDGMTQWFNDEYWLWQWNDWQRLDVSSWYREVDSYIPAGYSVGGVSSEFFDLTNLTNVSPVRTASDPDCCPSAGIITVSFAWVDQMLVINDAIYDPNTDFGSLRP